nr:arginase family protein [Phytoactinopolyspora alkaliphila]
MWGAPFDGGATLGWPGSRYGPEAIRRSLAWIRGRVEDEAVYWLDSASHHDLSGNFLTDRGDAEVVPSDLMASLDAVSSAITDTMDKERVPIFVGGDDSMLFGAVRGFHRSVSGSVGLIYLDAHFDLADTNAKQGGFSQSSGMRRCLELDRVAPGATIQVGLRNFNFPSSARYAEDVGLQVLTAKTSIDIGVTDSVRRIVDRVGGADHVVLTVDIDVVDPAFAPGSGAHEPGGFSSRHFLDLVTGLAPHCDALALMEVNPMIDVNDTTSRLAATAIFDFAVSGQERRKTL